MHKGTQLKRQDDEGPRGGGNLIPRDLTYTHKNCLKNSSTQKHRLACRVAMLRSLGHLVRRSRAPCTTALRSFAEGSAAAQSATAKLPSVPTHGTHGRYALALYMAGQKAGKLEVLDKDLQQVCGDTLKGHMLL